MTTFEDRATATISKVLLICKWATPSPKYTRPHFKNRAVDDSSDVVEYTDESIGENEPLTSHFIVSQPVVDFTQLFDDGALRYGITLEGNLDPLVKERYRLSS